MLGRREFIVTTLACAFHPIYPKYTFAKTTALDYISACLLGSLKTSIGNAVLSPDDLPDKDVAVNVLGEFANICNMFKIRSKLLFFGGDKSRNAFATTAGTAPGLDGTVYLGKDLVLGEIEAYSWFNVDLWGIMAHECGHVVQFSGGQSFSIKGGELLRRELEADFFAGYYLGTKWRETPFDTRAFRDSISQKGDVTGGTDQTHGTREQRVRAIEGGIRFGFDGIKSISEILDAASVEANNLVTLE
jgi:hypothetical protein